MLHFVSFRFVVMRYCFGIFSECFHPCFHCRFAKNQKHRKCNKSNVKTVKLTAQFQSGKRSNPLSIIKCKWSGAKPFVNHSNLVNELPDFRVLSIMCHIRVCLSFINHFSRKVTHHYRLMALDNNSFRCTVFTDSYRQGYSMNNIIQICTKV